MIYKRLLILVGLSFLAISVFSQKRLVIKGKDILFQADTVFLHGANTIAEIDKISEADAENIKQMGMNFVRLIIDIDAQADWNDTEADGNYIKESALTDWNTVIGWFTSREIWVLVEMRSNDYDLSDSDFWVPGSLLHSKWRKIWISLVSKIHTQDYIAAYGILAEHGQGNRTKVKDAFRPIMQSIDSITGGNTPYSFGPKLNSIEYYDTTNYTDWYWPEYANRIIYQINHLHPKPYINNDPSKGYDPSTWWYHRTDGQDGEGADNDDSMHKAGTLAHLAPGLAWRETYNAPIYIDQWGCAFNQPGYLDYERDMLDIFKEEGKIPNTRWTYYMANERGIMTQYYGTWQLHPPLKDFFTLNYVQGMNWPYETKVSNYFASDNNITTDAISYTLPWNIDFKFAQAFACNKIELWNTNNDASQDPKEIVVFGSADSLNWNPIFTVSNISFSGRRSQFFSPSAVNIKAYQYYRAQIVSNNGASSTSLSNVEFFPAAQSDLSAGIKSIPNREMSVRQENNYLIVDNINALKDVELRLFNVAGILCCQQEKKGKQTSLQVNVQGIKSGMYIILIQDEENVYSKRIFIK